jgi:hypothetical protein
MFCQCSEPLKKKPLSRPEVLEVKENAIIQPSVRLIPEDFPEKKMVQCGF